MLSAVAPERYGIWLILLSFIGWLGMSDLGIPSALQNRMIQLREKENGERAQALLIYGIKALTVIGATLFAVFAVAICIGGLHNWFKISEVYAWEFKFASLICLAGFAIGLPSKIGGVLHNVHGNVAYPPLFELSGTVASFTLLVLIAVTGVGSLNALALCMIGGVVAGGFASSLFGWRKYGYRYSKVRVPPEDARGLFTHGAFFFLTTIGELLILQSEPLLIGAIKGAESVVDYVIPMTLFVNFLQLQNIWLRPLWPVLTKLKAKNDESAVLAEIKRTLKYSLGVSCIFALGVIIFGDWFIKLWSRGGADLPSGMAMGLAMYIVVGAIDNAIAMFLNALAMPRRRCICAISLGVSKILFGWFYLTSLSGEVESLPAVYALMTLLFSIFPGTMFLFGRSSLVWQGGKDE